MHESIYSNAYSDSNSLVINSLMLVITSLYNLHMLMGVIICL